MADPNLPGNDPPIVRQLDPPTRTPNLIKCEFCECHLTPSGDCFRMSDRAKAINKQETRIEELTEQLAEVRAAITEAENELAEARSTIAKLTAPETRKKGSWEA